MSFPDWSPRYTKTLKKCWRENRNRPGGRFPAAKRRYCAEQLGDTWRTESTCSVGPESLPREALPLALPPAVLPVALPPAVLPVDVLPVAPLDDDEAFSILPVISTWLFT